MDGCSLKMGGLQMLQTANKLLFDTENLGNTILL